MRVDASKIWSWLKEAGFLVTNCSTAVIGKHDLEKAIEAVGVPGLRVDGVDYTPYQLGEIVHRMRVADLDTLERQARAWERVFDALSALVPRWYEGSKTAPAYDRFIDTMKELARKAGTGGATGLAGLLDEVQPGWRKAGWEATIRELSRVATERYQELSRAATERYQELLKRRNDILADKVSLASKIDNWEAAAKRCGFEGVTEALGHLMRDREKLSPRDYMRACFKFTMEYGGKEKRAALSVFGAKHYNDVPPEKRRQFLDYLRERGAALDRQAGRDCSVRFVVEAMTQKPNEQGG